MDPSSQSSDAAGTAIHDPKLAITPRLIQHHEGDYFEEEDFRQITNRNQSVTASYPSWDMMRNAAEKKLVAYPGAKMAFDGLTRRGIGREQLLDGLILMQIAKLMDTHPSIVRRNGTILRAAPEGMSWGQFSRFSLQP